MFETQRSASAPAEAKVRTWRRASSGRGVLASTRECRPVGHHHGHPRPPLDHPHRPHTPTATPPPYLQLKLLQTQRHKARLGVSRGDEAELFNRTLVPGTPNVPGPAAYFTELPPNRDDGKLTSNAPRSPMTYMRLDHARAVPAPWDTVPDPAPEEGWNGPGGRITGTATDGFLDNVEALGASIPGAGAHDVPEPPFDKGSTFSNSERVTVSINPMGPGPASINLRETSRPGGAAADPAVSGKFVSKSEVSGPANQPSGRFPLAQPRVLSQHEFATVGPTPSSPRLASPYWYHYRPTTWIWLRSAPCNNVPSPPRGRPTLPTTKTGASLYAWTRRHGLTRSSRRRSITLPRGTTCSRTCRRSTIPRPSPPPSSR